MKILVLIFLTVSTFAAEFNEEYVHHIKDEAKKMWHTLDYNHNKNFDQDDLKQMIHFYDTDGNKNVSREEFVFHFDMDAPNLAIEAGALFGEYDDNGNNMFEETDIDGILHRIDLNKDGFVEHHEFSKYFEEALTILYMIQLQQHQSTMPGTTGPSALPNSTTTMV